MGNLELTIGELKKLVADQHRIYTEQFQKAIDLVSQKDTELACAIVSIARETGLDIVIKKEIEVPALSWRNEIRNALGNKSLSIIEIQAKTHLDYNSIYYELCALRQEKQVVKVGSGRASKYQKVA
jgi:hypothetical protein